MPRIKRREPDVSAICASCAGHSRKSYMRFVDDPKVVLVVPPIEKTGVGLFLFLRLLQEAGINMDDVSVIPSIGCIPDGNISVVLYRKCYLRRRDANIAKAKCVLVFGKKQQEFMFGNAPNINLAGGCEVVRDNKPYILMPNCAELDTLQKVLAERAQVLSHTRSNTKDYYTLRREVEDLRGSILDLEEFFMECCYAALKAPSLISCIRR